MGDLGDYWRDVKAHYKNNIRETKGEREHFYKRLAELQERTKELYEALSGAGIEVKKFANGQLFLGGVIDWWTTTGTAIVRKTKKRYYFTDSKPQEIVTAVLQEIKSANK